MLSSGLQSQLEQDGIARLAGVFDESAAGRMTAAIWRSLAERHGVLRDDPITWTVRQPTGFQELTRGHAFDAVGGTLLRHALDELFGAGGWREPEHWGAPLVTFPEPSEEWRVPHAQWHLDFPARGVGWPGIRVLAFLAPVRPRGGGTLVLAGSQVLVERLVAAGGAGDGKSAVVRAAVGAKNPWLRELWSAEAGGDGPQNRERFEDGETTADGVKLRVVELTGAPGDVVLMHPWAFHAPSPNCGDQPRLMVSHSIFRVGAP